MQPLWNPEVYFSLPMQPRLAQRKTSFKAHICNKQEKYQLRVTSTKKIWIFLLCAPRKLRKYVENLAFSEISDLGFAMVIHYRPERSCDKVSFCTCLWFCSRKGGGGLCPCPRVSVGGEGDSVQGGGLCPEWRVSVKDGGLCPGWGSLSRVRVSVQGESLCPGGLCPGVSVQGVSVKGGLCLGLCPLGGSLSGCPGGFCLGGICLRGLCQGGSLSRGLRPGVSGGIPVSETLPLVQ